MLTGGLSHLDELRKVIGQRLGEAVLTSENARFAGAIGAAIIGSEKAGRS